MPPGGWVDADGQVHSPNFKQPQRKEKPWERRKRREHAREEKRADGLQGQPRAGATVAQLARGATGTAPHPTRSASGAPERSQGETPVSDWVDAYHRARVRLGFDGAPVLDVVRPGLREKIRAALGNYPEISWWESTFDKVSQDDWWAGRGKDGQVKFCPKWLLARGGEKLDEDLNHGAFEGDGDGDADDGSTYEAFDRAVARYNAQKGVTGRQALKGQPRLLEPLPPVVVDDGDEIDLAKH